MAILTFSSSNFLLKLSRNPRLSLTTSSAVAYTSSYLSSCSMPATARVRLSSLSISAASGEIPEPIPKPDAEEKEGGEETSAESSKLADEWGEKYEIEPIPEVTKLADSDPPKDEDEWEERDEVVGGADNGYSAASSAPTKEINYQLQDLKRSLVDTFYGTDFGFRAGSEIRAEVSELVYQLETANPTPAPSESPQLLNGTWILLYTASSELLPLLAAGSLPLVRVDSIKQTIDTNSLEIINSITLSNPFSTLSFSASATFEVRSPTRVQVTFKEGILQPPEIKSRIDLPENVDIFGQKISLSAVQQTLRSLQEPVASISQTISGQPPLKIPIPGERTSSWLITTYLDEDLRISRGDGGLFILAREGSSLALDQ